MVKLRVCNGTKNWVEITLDRNDFKIDLEDADDLLQAIFCDRGYDDVISWLSNRMGGMRSRNQMLDVIRANGARSFKDNIIIQIVEE